MYDAGNGFEMNEERGYYDKWFKTYENNISIYRLNNQNMSHGACLRDVTLYEEDEDPIETPSPKPVHYGGQKNVSNMR